MTIDEIAKLVGRIAITDNRAIDRTILLDWEQILPEWLTYEMAIHAVIEHRRTSTEYLMPAHIIAIAQQQRDRTPQAADQLQLPADAITLNEYVRRHPEDQQTLQRIYHRQPGRFLATTGE